jgi:molybdopterin-guanine dinucleotide biosynthesis protein A
LAADPVFAAVVLSGGRARRLGGADKPGLEVGGRTLAAAVVSAARQAGAARIVVVGPYRPGLAGELTEAAGAPVEFTSERPAGAGPVPAVRAGLELVREQWLLLLAADLPFLTPDVLRDLVGAASLGHGATLADDLGQPQWLLSCWPTEIARAALTGHAGDSLRGLLAPLPHRVLAVTPGPGDPPYWMDCDMPQDLAAATRWLTRPGMRRSDTSGPTGLSQRHLRSNGAVQPPAATTLAVRGGNAGDGNNACARLTGAAGLGYAALRAGVVASG